MDGNCRKKWQAPGRIKIITMGTAEAGKSCLIKRFCEKRFVSKYAATIGIDYGVAKLKVNDQEVKISIFDMSGHPIFYDVRNEFYSGTHGALLVYDATDRSSFEALDLWLAEMAEELGGLSEMEKTTFVVCANKCDKMRDVDEEEGKLWATLHHFPYFETSALTGDGVAEMFQAMLTTIVRNQEAGGKLAARIMANHPREQLEAVHRLRWANDDYQKLGLYPRASRDEINRAYRRLAVLLHPDKSKVPGSEDAFKTLVATRATLLRTTRT